jgi:general nucleoside transport system permease protein
MGPFDVSWLASAIKLATPLILAGTGELIAERTGVINIGLEGMMLSGAFFGFLISWLTDGFWLGVIAGAGAGMAIAALMALLSINIRADQIVVGVGLNILALGVTTFTFRQIFLSRGEVILSQPAPLRIPLLSHLPILGRALFSQTMLVYVAFVLVAVAWFVLYRTSWGLAIRAAGEVPSAADTAGVSVAKIRWIGTLVAGAMSGVAGAFLSIGQLGLFVEGMSAGRGFIALAAVIFGGWGPFGVMGAGLVFGGADALQIRIQAAPSVPRQVWLALAIVAVLYVAIRSRSADRLSALGYLIGTVVVAAGVLLFAMAPDLKFPPQLWLAVPYVLALLALAGVVGRVRMPSALAVPYRRGSGGGV